MRLFSHQQRPPHLGSYALERLARMPSPMARPQPDRQHGAVPRRSGCGRDDAGHQLIPMPTRMPSKPWLTIWVATWSVSVRARNVPGILTAKTALPWSLLAAPDARKG